MRVVSLIASATEIVCALGCRDMLVGRSHECDFPPDVAALPVLTEPKFQVSGTSREIDQRVKAIVQEGASVYRVFADRLQELAPDVIVTQDQCEICAASLSDVEDAMCDWTDQPVRVVSLKPDGLEDIWRDIATVASALGVDEVGEALVRDLRGRMSAIRERAAVVRERPRVACIEWIDPPMAAGNWVPELVELAGGENLFGEAGKPSPWITWAAVRAADPDFIVVMPCGFDIDRAMAEMPVLAQHPGWAELSAVRNGRVIVVDGNQYFNRPGPRVVESLEIMAQILYPERMDFGHEGGAWIHWSPAGG